VAFIALAAKKRVELAAHRPGSCPFASVCRGRSSRWVEVLDVEAEGEQLSSAGKMYERLERMLEDLSSERLDPTACPAHPER
jgi:hypothetical protein